MPKYKNSNETFWVIFKHCAKVVKLQKCTKTRFKSHCFNRFFRVIITYYCVVGKWRYINWQMTLISASHNLLSQRRKVICQANWLLQHSHPGLRQLIIQRSLCQRQEASFIFTQRQSSSNFERKSFSSFHILRCAIDSRTPSQEPVFCRLHYVESQREGLRSAHIVGKLPKMSHSKIQISFVYTTNFLICI